MFSAHYSTQRRYGSHILRFCSPLVTVQNTTCGSAHYCSPDDGHNDARNMLRKFDNKHQISCILLVSLSSPYLYSVVCKQVEHVIAGYLRQVWDTNKWLYEGQHGFRPGC